MTIIQSRDTTKQTTCTPLFLPFCYILLYETSFVLILNIEPFSLLSPFSFYKSEPLSKTKLHKLQLFSPFFFLFFVFLFSTKMVLTKSLSFKYPLLFFCTIAFNLLASPLCALNIGAETTGVAVSVVSFMLKLSNSNRTH